MITAIVICIWVCISGGLLVALLAAAAKRLSQAPHPAVRHKSFAFHSGLLASQANSLRGLKKKTEARHNGKKTESARLAALHPVSAS